MILGLRKFTAIAGLRKFQKSSGLTFYLDLEKFHTAELRNSSTQGKFGKNLEKFHQVNT